MTNGKHVACKECLECITCGLCRCRTIDIAHLEAALARMTERSQLWAIVKKEVTKRGYWNRYRKGSRKIK